MSRFEVDILGCGSAVPTPYHNASSQVLNIRDHLYMIDCGEGAQSMFRKMRLHFSRLDAIFISHLHGDHCLGLPGLLSTLALNGKEGVLTVYMPAEGIDVMRRTVDFFCRERSYDLRFVAIEGQGGELMRTKAMTVTAFPLYHRVPCYGFIFRENPKPRHLRADMLDFYNVPVAQRNAIKNGADFVTPDGTVIDNARLTTPADPAISYAYCSDTVFDPRVAKAVEGVTAIYHEATYHSDMAERAAERGHSTAAQAGEIAAMAGAQSLIIGHYSKRYTDLTLLVDDARTRFPDVTAANEGMRIVLQK